MKQYMDGVSIMHLFVWQQSHHNFPHEKHRFTALPEGAVAPRKDAFTGQKCMRWYRNPNRTYSAPLQLLAGPWLHRNLSDFTFYFSSDCGTHDPSSQTPDLDPWGPPS